MGHVSWPDVKRLASQIAEGDYAYPGPLTFRTVGELTARLAELDPLPGSTPPVTLARVLHWMQDALENAPRRGVAAVMHPFLEDALSALLGGPETALLLKPDRQLGEAFSAPSTYWKDFPSPDAATPDNVPPSYVWAQDQMRLVKADPIDISAPHIPIPIACQISYQASGVDNALSWAVAFHELGHHLYHAFRADAFNPDRRNSRVDQFQTACADLALLQEEDVTGANVHEYTDDSPSSRWGAELFADIVAVRVMGLAYCAVLRAAAVAAQPSVHPPLAVRIDTLRSVVTERVKHLPSDTRRFLEAALDPSSDFPQRTQTGAEEAAAKDELPHYSTIVDSLHQWVSDDCVPLVDELFEASPNASRWRDQPDQVDQAISLLRDYVPPAGELVVAVDADGGTARIAPATLGSVMLAGSFVRYEESVFSEFVRPWNDKREADEKLSKLLTKALSTLLVEERLQRSGTDRPSDLDQTEQ